MNWAKIWDKNEKNQPNGKIIGKLAYGWHDGRCYSASRPLDKETFIIAASTAYNLSSFLYDLNFDGEAE